MNKLISMTDFVLEQNLRLSNGEISLQACSFIILKYALFLKQPLKLEMFLLCNEEGNILEEPKQTSLTCSFFEQQQFFNKQKKYEKAKEKVLFEGWDKRIKDIHLFSKEISNKTIEDVIPWDLTLTENALKQIGL